MSYERMLKCTENAINEFGLLRAEGIDRDAWPLALMDANRALWAAYHALKARIELRDHQSAITAYYDDKAQSGQPPPQPR